MRNETRRAALVSLLLLAFFAGPAASAQLEPAGQQQPAPAATQQAEPEAKRPAPVTLAGPASSPAPAPLLAKGHPVEWLFVFKFNAASFPACGPATVVRSCLFGGEVQTYPQPYSQQFVSASSEDQTLRQGGGCVGDSTADPLGATFDEIYNGHLYYVVWNDQFYGDPKAAGCGKECGAPWGHSKGVLAWNEEGQGMVLQVSTPAWPGAGSSEHPRMTDGNTLGCVKDNDVLVSQHFFALKLSPDDVVQVLKALGNASVVTDPKNPQTVHNGGPAAVVELVNGLGTLSKSTEYLDAVLSSGVELISKPSRLHVPPWQMVSAVLGGAPLRTANWWTEPGAIYSTTGNETLGCWDKTQLQPPGAVEIATSGVWGQTTIGLKGGVMPNGNHAKLGVATGGVGGAAEAPPYAIFGDMNQEGSLDGPKCDGSQNGRGGTFYVVKEAGLAKSLTGLLTGTSAPAGAAGASDAGPEKVGVVVP